MVDFDLRPARFDDAPGIKALVRAVHINPLDLDWRRFVIAQSGQVDLLGCGQVKPHRGGLQELASIAVWPEYRNQGVARAIIERLIFENPQRLYLMCASLTCPMYEKFGFRALEIEEMPLYFARMIRLANLFGRFSANQPQIRVMRRD